MRRFHPASFQQSLPLVAACVLVSSECHAQQPQTSAIWTTAQVKDRASVGMTVRISGVVTGTAGFKYFVQDEWGAMPVVSGGPGFTITPGDVVEVVGVALGAGAGRQMTELQRIKTGTAPLPEPETATPAQLINGGALNQRVKITGTIHDVAISHLVLLQLESAGSSIPVSWRPQADEDKNSIKALLDAVVEVTGVAQAPWTPEGRSMELRIEALSLADVHVVQPGSASPFKRPLREIRSLVDIENNHSSRVRVKGHVTFASDAGWLYLRDATGIALARPRSPWTLVLDPASFKLGNPPVRTGDIVELVALPEPGASPVARLNRAEWRVTGHDDLPSFQPLSAEEVLESNFDGLPVSLTAEVIDVTSHDETPGIVRHVLTMMSDTTPFNAVLEKPGPASLPVRAGDFALLTGVVTTTKRSSAGRPLAFELNLGSLADVHPVAPPPAWRNSVLLRWLFGVLVLAVAAFAWIIMLRRQVKAQTAQLQSRLDRELELSEMKSRFVFTVSHEFRNPLAVIMSCSDVLERYREKLVVEQYHRQIEGIKGSVRRMADLMEEVLLLGRAEAGRLRYEPENVELAAFCQKLVDQTSAATAGRCSIGLICDELPGPVSLDRSLLQHILTNLLTNAVKYSSPGSPVSLEIQRIDKNLQFRVSDCGHGIPARDQVHLFEPFHRGGNVGETPGTGLGLAIVKRCVSAHGGSIQCDSHEGKGTLFTVLLPLVHASDATPAS